MSPTTPDWRPPAPLLRAAATTLCGLVLLAGVAAAGYVGVLLAPVLLPLVVVALVSRALWVPVDALRSRGWPSGRAAAVAMAGAGLLLAILIALIGPPIASQLAGLGPTVEEGIADVEDWLVSDAPVEVTPEQIDDAKDGARERVGEALRSEGVVSGGVRIAGEVAAGLVVALVLTYFALAHGPALVARARELLPEERRARADAAAGAVWTTLGGYLRGSAILGIVEAVVIGLAMAIAGSELVLPLMLVTFLAAFVPVLGAITAGVLAVVVTLATAGPVAALVVGAVAVAVQQLDSDLLGPWVFGKALDLHPAAVLIALLTGTALLGLVGTVLAVPATACTASALFAVRDARRQDHDPVSDDVAAIPSG